MNNNITFEVSDEINTDGTSKRGQVRTTFKNITRAFGAPTDRMGDNSFNEWRIQFKIPDNSEVGEFDYEIATIYDWSEEADPARNPFKEYVFNVGGNNLDAVYYVHQVLSE